MSKPIVAHFVRGFLRPTETFIGNQIISLERYTPRVFCHHRISGHSFPTIHATVLTDSISPIRRKVELAFYDIFRALTPYGSQVLSDKVIKGFSKILHFHYLVEARFFLPIAKRLKLPSIVSGYGWDVSSFPLTKFGFGKEYLQPIFREMDLFLAMSEDMKKDMMKIGCPESKIVVHYFGNEINRFVSHNRQYINKKEIRILFCGRLASKKAPHLVLRALKILEMEQKKIPVWKLVYVGDGPLHEQLKKIVNEFGWNHRVDFMGHIPYNSSQFVEEYQKADIYILPSITVLGEKEGIPGSLIEAMSSGLPCISTYHAGIPSVITDGIDGFLNQEGDIISMAKSLSILICDADVREKIGMAAAKRAQENFNLKNRTNELENIYDTVLNSKNNHFR